MASAQTGSGKTAAFALPLLSRLEAGNRNTQVLVLAPTRELALQVAEAELRRDDARCGGALEQPERELRIAGENERGVVARRHEDHVRDRGVREPAVAGGAGVPHQDRVRRR